MRRQLQKLSFTSIASGVIYDKEGGNVSEMIDRFFDTDDIMDASTAAGGKYMPK